MLLTSSGCGIIIQEARVKNHFARAVGCPAATLASEGRGYRVEGCSAVAHFSCFDRNDRFARENTLSGALAAAVVEVTLDSDTCVLTKVDFRSDARLENDGQEALALRIPVDGGHVRLYALPATHPEHALLALHSDEPLKLGCPLYLFRDGEPVPIELIAHLSEHELRARVALAQLISLGRASRLLLTCGREFQIEQPQRQAMASFAMQTKESTIRGTLGVAARGGERAEVRPLADSFGAHRDAHAGGPARAQRGGPPPLKEERSRP
jgi:hypothetical protein